MSLKLGIPKLYAIWKYSSKDLNIEQMRNYVSILLVILLLTVQEK